jgi:hypothetical protein
MTARNRFLAQINGCLRRFFRRQPGAAISTSAEAENLTADEEWRHQIFACVSGLEEPLDQALALPKP